jgi:hypothetical protein
MLALIEFFETGSFPLRPFFCLSLLASAFFLVLNCHDEVRGKTSVTRPGSAYSPSIPERFERAQDPAAFRRAMNYQWLGAQVLALIGTVGLTALERRDRLDPFSPHYPWTDKAD